MAIKCRPPRCVDDLIQLLWTEIPVYKKSSIREPYPQHGDSRRLNYSHQIANRLVSQRKHTFIVGLAALRLEHVFGWRFCRDSPTSRLWQFMRISQWQNRLLRALSPRVTCNTQ